MRSYLQRIQYVALPLALSGVNALSRYCLAQSSIVPAQDGTGTEVQSIEVFQDDRAVQQRFDIGGGTQAGENLFHTFEQFGLDTDDVAHFLAQPDIQNILSRVIGGDISLINGLIQISNSQANLFLINPSGIIFGPDARLDVPADFTATTAEAVGFDQGILHSLDSNDYTVLVGNPNQFIFLPLSSANPAEGQTDLAQGGTIVNFGNLSVQPEQTLALLGRTVLNHGILTAVDGQVITIAVPDGQLIRIHQPGMILSLELASESVLESVASNPSSSATSLTAQSAAQLPDWLTGGDLHHASHLIITPDGQIYLTSTEGLIHNTGTITAGTIDLEARTLLNSGMIHVGGVVGGAITGRLLYLENSGEMRADGTHGRGGTIDLQALERIMQTAGGVISAQGNSQGKQGQPQGSLKDDGEAHGGTISLNTTQAILSGRIDVSSGDLPPTTTPLEQPANANDPSDMGADSGADNHRFTDSANEDTANQIQPNQGGNIQILGETLILLGATLEASGEEGGGLILIGGEGRGPHTQVTAQETTAQETTAQETTAQETLVNDHTVIRADALGNGDGGTVVVWSDQNTRFGGSIAARGGPEGGDGGFVEVSSQQGGQFSGTVDASAPAGQAGQFLLDPKNIIIQDGGIGTGLALVQTLLDSGTPADGEGFGASVAIEGTNVLIGAPDDSTVANEAGAAFLFDANGNPLRTFLDPVTPLINERFGASVAIDDDYVLVGAPLDDNFGAAFLFDLTDIAFSQALTAPIPQTGAQFGSAVAIDGDNLVIGSPLEDMGGFTGVGAVRLFDTDGTFLRTFENPEPDFADLFGLSVAIEATNLLVGVSPDDALGISNSGSVYLFDTNDNSNPLQTFTHPTNPEVGGQFGRIVAIDDAQILITSPLSDVNGVADVGEAFLFNPDGDLLSVFNNPAPQATDQFGASAALSSSRVLIGVPEATPTATPTATEAGTAYLFDVNGTLLTEVENPTPDAFDGFGNAVAIDGSLLVIGASSDDTAGLNAGAAYLFEEGDFDLPTQFVQSPDDSFIFDADVITTVTNTGTDFTLQANNDITVNETIASTGDGELTLQAGRSILINQNILSVGGDLTLVANETLANGVVDTARDAGDATIATADGVVLNTGTGDITITLDAGTGLSHNGSGDITLGDLVAGNMSLLNRGPDGGDIVVSTIDASGGDGVGGGGDITIEATGGNVLATGTLTTPTACDGASLCTFDGDIVITHGITEPFNAEAFQIGNATTNGTAGSIVAGTTTLNDRAIPNETGTFSEGGILITPGGTVSMPDPEPPIDPTPDPNPPLVLTPREDLITISDPGGCPPFCHQRDQPQLEVSEPLIESILAPSIEAIEAQFSQEFVDYLGLETFEVQSFREIQKALLDIEAATTVKSAVIYAIFRPKTVTVAQNSISHSSVESVTSKGVGQTYQPDDELELLLVTGRGSPVRRRIAGVTRQQALFTLRQFRQALASPDTPLRSYLDPAQTLHGWLIEPLEAVLQQQEIDSLLFALDTGLRSTPLPALHNGETFLIERYSTGVVPTLSLTDTRYRDIRNTGMVAMGASVFESQDPLPSVPLELENLTENIWRGTAYLNEAFTLEKLLAESQGIGIVHLATHADFVPGAIGNSYIQLFDQQLGLDQIRQMGWQHSGGQNIPVELLTLSACRTAVGSEEVELGFAGLAVQAGVKTALASLWEVNDAVTAGLMIQFYSYLKQFPIKAEALRRTQIALLNQRLTLEANTLQGLQGPVTALALPAESLTSIGPDNLIHPYYWSGFTLVGSPW